ncbi:hypothetical protein TNCV_3775611 [Trichonephila clavipes]|nr:hypothetical protein TNCV_3775611 [Trichonephila clavipes]
MGVVRGGQDGSEEELELLRLLSKLGERFVFNEGRLPILLITVHALKLLKGWLVHYSPISVVYEGGDYICPIRRLASDLLLPLHRYRDRRGLPLYP